MFKAIIFDLDGTLFDLPINYSSLYEKVCEILGVAEIRSLLNTVAQIEDTQVLRKIFDVWTSFELDIIDKVTVHTEGMQLYSQHAKLPNALVTMQGRETVHRICQKFSIQFDTAITREDSLNRAEQIKMATSKLGFTLQDTLFIGNLDNDENAAKQVKCQFLRVK
ncbi:MAG: HAD hydrolase-like protein [Nitrososphaerota archaeon]|jgi:phosphoglycolate phosphatase-like HAD superfamily hydrolase|nr:HAD hydrolase-like protein [Nitrososphaerota archaeon]